MSNGLDAYATNFKTCEIIKATLLQQNCNQYNLSLEEGRKSFGRLYLSLLVKN